ncbi:MAG: DUF3823 domain-containing protein [Tannerellaceae bacterium]|nr:DUF3823 domain-containing protein [Tannerellaceae bacterium]
MKTIKSIFLLFLLLVVVTGCGKDNYDAPTSVLTGQVVYKGEAIQVRGTDERVRLQLYQDGYDFRDPIDVFVTQDGSFSALLFDGEYELQARDNNGPWVNSRDIVKFTVKGNTVQDYEVQPYFMIRNPKISLSGEKVTYTFTLDHVETSRNLNFIMLLVGQTTFVDDEYKVQREDIRQDRQTGEFSFTLDLNNEAKAAAFLYGRIGVYIDGVDQPIYSPVVKLK